MTQQLHMHRLPGFLYYRGVKPQEQRPKRRDEAVAKYSDSPGYTPEPTIDGEPEEDWLTCTLEEFYAYMDEWYGPEWREVHTT